jgi:type II secretory pathway component PulF
MDLPASTRALIWFTRLIELHGLSIFAGLLIGLAGFTWLARQPFAKPVTHLWLLHTPIVKTISLNANLANFCRTLGTLLKSGLNIDEALEITKDTLDNHYFKKSLAKASARVRQGTKLSDNLADNGRLFPRLVTSMVRIGEKSGNLEETLFYLADFYDNEVDVATKTLSTAIEPILLIAIGLAVGGLAVSIIGPIYKITGNVQR